MPTGVRYIVDRQSQKVVKNLKLAGYTNEEIAKILGICDDTLVKYYHKEISFAVQRTEGAIAGVMVKKALDGDIHAAKFWLKTRGKKDWRDDAKDEEENDFRKVLLEMLKKSNERLSDRDDLLNKKENDKRLKANYPPMYEDGPKESKIDNSKKINLAGDTEYSVDD